MSISRKKAAFRTAELLRQVGAVDETARVVRAAERIAVRCGCGIIGEAVFNNAANALKKHGVGWRCRTCKNLAISESSKHRIGAANPFYGRHHTEETKRCLSLSAAERQSSIPAERKRAAGMAGYTAVVEKYGDNPMNIPEIRERHAAAVTSKEFVDAASQRMTERMANSEARSKISKDSKAFWDSEAGRKMRAQKSTDWSESWNKAGGAVYEKRVIKLRKAQLDRGEEIASKARATMLERYGVENAMQSPDIRRKVLARRGMLKPERIINEMLSNRGINYCHQFDLNGKTWDFAVLDKNGNPVLVIETDGEYYHGLTADPYNSHTMGHADPQRFAKLPDGVKYLQVDGKKAKAAIPEIIRMLGIDYGAWMKEIYDACFGKPFPYPNYDEKRLRSDWKHLCSMRQYNKRLMPANSLVIHFHKSLYTSRVGNMPSPVEAWGDPDLLMKCIKNRFIYQSVLSSVNIARGFERNGIARRVSAFQPALARHLLQKFAPPAVSVVDPFSGFSGRMLGAQSLGKRYVGYDVNAVVVEESKRIADFLNFDKRRVSLSVSAIETLIDADGYDALLTSPPYGSKERWGNEECREADYYVELAMRKLECGVYIFVVDKTEKYSQFVADRVINESHFNKNEELVLVISRDQRNAILGIR